MSDRQLPTDTVEINAGSWAEAFEKLEQLAIGMAERVEHPNMRPEHWQATTDLLQELHSQYFVNEADPHGVPWRPLSPYTIRMKGHSRILYEFGDLVASLTDSGSRYAVRQPGSDELEFGTSRPHAWKHQDGYDIIPQREHTGVGDRGADEVAEVVADTAVALMFEYRA